MISERSFAASFPGFWAELLPLLTPNFVAVINDGLKERLTDKCGARIVPVPKNPDICDPSLVAEFSFSLAKIAVEEQTTIDEVINNSKLRMRAEQYAIKVIAKYEMLMTPLKVSLEKPELDEGFILAMNYQWFLNSCASGQIIQFSPQIPGAGFLLGCEGDISIGTTLIEVKTVDRNLTGKDIRQLVIYLALQAATGERRWTKAGFFNPRRAVYNEFIVDDMIQRMGGRPAIEVFKDFIDFVCVRDVQIDTAF